MLGDFLLEEDAESHAESEASSTTSSGACFRLGFLLILLRRLFAPEAASCCFALPCCLLNSNISKANYLLCLESENDLRLKVDLPPLDSQNLRKFHRGSENAKQRLDSLRSRAKGS